MVTDQAGEMIALGQGEMPVTTVERQRAFKIYLFALGRIIQRDTETFPQHRPYGDHYRQLGTPNRNYDASYYIARKNKLHYIFLF